ncbi:MAG: LacI family DNA-binding transcriptional regulator [Deltaproteobacteria bacterium]|nr:LacI family DNA-binding transcriptional regulator [Deltaproteobacteria bacterium]MBW2120496.1 LacI family DNA-binding transcriptional regulator [Deltaproteobacteria bacterium]
MEPKPTIKDIARLARVSHTTVSRALNDRPRVSRRTRDRILAIAKKLNYRPNVAARSLKVRRTKTLGLVITTIINPFYPELAQGIENTAREMGYNIILCSTNYDIDLELRHIEMLRSKGVDGIIFTSTHIHDPNIEGLVEEGFPIILVNRKTYDESIGNRVDYVVIENSRGAFMAVEHLIRMGHRRIGIITGLRQSSASWERLEGVERAMTEYGVELDPDLVVEGDFLKASGGRAAKRFSRMKVPPTAVFAVNDYMALGAMEGFMEEGLRIPHDMALVGFNDIEISRMRNIELTTVGQKTYEMGSIAVRTLVEKIEGEAQGLVRQIILEPELLIRKSCGYFLSGYKREALRHGVLAPERPYP